VLCLYMPSKSGITSPSAPSGRRSVKIPSGTLGDLYSDSREHGAYRGPSIFVRLPHVTSGGGAIARNGDGSRCAVTGKECEQE
jgi:WD repeat-containing protein 24